jgi:hypothetical protein
MMDLLPFFNWLDTSWLADLAKSNGGVFAVVQMVHLLALSLLGGMVLVQDLRLFGLVLQNVELREMLRYTEKWFDIALATSVVSGIFMSSAVAMKLFYNEMFWAKMTALLVGAILVYTIERPLLRRMGDDLRVVTCRLLGASSLMIWFTVAAAGRWIGFS